MPETSRGLPLVARSAGALIARQDGVGITVSQLLARAAGLARKIPAQAPVINLCEDRIHFLSGFLATLMRGGPCLLPPNALPATQQEIRSAWPDALLLTDREQQDLTMPALAVAQTASAEACNPEIPADQLAAVLYTSGSTGPSMPIRKSWQTLVAGARINLRYYLDAASASEHSPYTVVATVPPQHMYGLEASVMSTLLGPVVCTKERPFFPEDIRAALQRIPAPRMLVTSPAHLRAMVRSGLDYPAVARILCATAPLDQILAAQAEALLCAELIEIYGSTEVGSMAWRPGARASAWRFFEGFEIAQESACTTVKAAHLQEVVPLNDILEFSPNGEFELTGRTGDLVKIAGKRGSLAQITQKLQDLPTVTDAVAFLHTPPPGVAGEPRIAALIVSTGELETIRQALREVLDPVFVPRWLHKVDSLPRNATGKLVQQDLSQMLHSLTF